jgi:branched-chain amino acid transport system substrate-binding protein
MTSILLAACSSSTKSTAGSSSTTSAEGSSNTTTATNKTPITVGWVSLDIGQKPFVGPTDGAKAAEAYINATGGVNGHPINLVTCSVDATVQLNQQCAEQMANNPHVSVVLVGLTLNGPVLYTTLTQAGKPVLGGIPLGPQDYTNPNVVWYYSGGAGTFTAFEQMVEQLKPKTVAVIEDAQGVHDNVVQAEAAIEKNLNNSVKFTSGILPVPATDYLPAAVASGAQTADMVYIATSQNCLPMAQALATLHPKGLIATTSACITPTTVAQSPSSFEGWYSEAFYVLSIAKNEPASSGQAVFNNEYPKYSKSAPGSLPPTFAETGWGLVMTLRNVLQMLPDSQISSPTAIGPALRAFKGPVVMGNSSISCPGPNPYPSVCSLSNEPFWRIQNGSFESVSTVTG